VSIPARDLVASKDLVHFECKRENGLDDTVGVWCRRGTAGDLAPKLKNVIPESRAQVVSNFGKKSRVRSINLLGRTYERRIIQKAKREPEIGTAASRKRVFHSSASPADAPAA